MIRPVLLPLLVLLLAGCTEEGRSGGGMIITSDGRFIANTDRNAKKETERAIATSLSEQLGEGWTVRATLDGLPELYERPDPHGNDWVWMTPSARVELHGQGTSSMTEAQITASIAGYLLKKRHPRSEAAPVVTVVVGGPVAVAVPQSASGEARTYVAQPGDTWADMATAFYGSPQEWRKIKDANPGAGDRPVPGTTVTIP